MRFAIAAIDSYLGVFEAFVAAGWQPVKLFTVPIRNQFDGHEGVIALAGQHQARVQLSRITRQDLAELHDQGCEALVVASYDWKIDNWRPFLKYAVNFHPSPLPEGRGPYPLVRAIMERRSVWGVTCHRLAPKMDAGEMLAAENFPMQADECHESLRLKVQMAAQQLAVQVAGNFIHLWNDAQPQIGGSYWPKWSHFDRLIDFAQPVKNILCHLRAFGSMESLVWLNDNAVLSVKHAVGWTAAHTHSPGHIISSQGRTVLIAAADGYIAVLEWQFAPPDVTADIQSRLANYNSGFQQGRV
jgi:methionyl-tRNA formyltransferase